MQTLIVPNPEKVGKYLCYIIDCKSPEELFAVIEEKGKDLTKIFVHFLDNSVPSEKFLLTINTLYRSLEVRVLTRDEIQRISSDEILIPNWVYSSVNFPKVVAGAYNEIKPTTAEFITTLNCNFRCNQCSYAEPKKEIGVWKEARSNKPQYNFNEKLHMTEQTMKISIDKLIEGGVKNILFTGGGEPFFNADITLKGMRYAKSKGLIIGLYSNGSLLNKNIVKEIFDISPLFVRISIYGSTNTSFSKYTNQKENVFFKVIENIKLLSQEKNRINSNTQLGLSYLVHPDTTPEISHFSEMLRERFSMDELSAINFIRFTPAVEYFGKHQHSQRLMEDVFLSIEKVIKPVIATYGINVKLYYHRLADLNLAKPYTTCRASGWYLEIGPNGDVYLCCEKLFLPDYKIGNLLEQNLNDIFSGQARNQVISHVNKSKCQDCPTLCKPHELNKIFEGVEDFRKKDDYNRLEIWKNELLRFGKPSTHTPGRLNDFES